MTLVDETLVTAYFVRRRVGTHYRIAGGVKIQLRCCGTQQRAPPIPEWTRVQKCPMGRLVSITRWIHLVAWMDTFQSGTVAMTFDRAASFVSFAWPDATSRNDGRASS